MMFHIPSHENDTLIKRDITCFCLDCEDSFCRTSGHCYGKSIDGFPDSEIDYGCANLGDFGFALSDVCEDSNLTCCDYDFCNRKFHEIATSIYEGLLEEEKEIERESFNYLAIIIVSIIFIVIISVLMVSLVLKRRSNRPKVGDKLYTNFYNNNLKERFINSIGKNDDYWNLPSSSSLSSSVPFEEPLGSAWLSIDEESKLVKLEEILHNGNISSVYKANGIGSQPIAVIFYKKNGYFLAKHEERLHDSIVCKSRSFVEYIGKGTRFSNGLNEFCILTNYHLNGSLQEFLSHNKIDLKTASSLVLSATECLNACHVENLPLDIAHNKINCRNFLVKETDEGLQCLLSDFTASTYIKNDEVYYSNGFDLKTNARFLAPEILENLLIYGNIDNININDLKKADVYSLALVLWCILSRIETNHSNDFRLPYQDIIDDEFNLHTMHDVVQKNRPRFTFFGKNNCYNFEKIINICEESWSTEPDIRPLILNTLTRIRSWSSDSHTGLFFGSVSIRIDQN